MLCSLALGTPTRSYADDASFFIIDSMLLDLFADFSSLQITHAKVDFFYGGAS